MRGLGFKVRQRRSARPLLRLGYVSYPLVLLDFDEGTAHHDPIIRIPSAEKLDDSIPVLGEQDFGFLVAGGGEDLLALEALQVCVLTILDDDDSQRTSPVFRLLPCIIVRTPCQANPLR
jgi:hypothetical protein